MFYFKLYIDDYKLMNYRIIVLFVHISIKKIHENKKYNIENTDLVFIKAF